MKNDALMPLGDATARDIRDIKQPGFVVPVRQRDETLLITKWGDEMCAIMLTGEHSFIFFPISLRSPHTGLFIPAPEILIDLSSATDARNIDQERGLLILAQNSLSVVASKAGDQFGDPQPVPLWRVVDGGSEAASVAFAKWGIGIRQGDGFRTLWERGKPTRSFYENVE
ncbi:MAG TPA: hypothetical protein VFZ91_09510 [Allosphingosinicella sp.]